MKLLTRYNRLTIMVTIMIMVVAAVVYYFTITLVLSKQVDKALIVEENEVQEYVAVNNALPHIFTTNHQSVTFTKTANKLPRAIRDTVYQELKGNEIEPARVLYTNVQVAGQNYLVTVIQSTVETEDLLKLIFGITSGLIFTLLAALFFINRFILSSIWQPFYVFLNQLKGFKVAENTGIPAIASNIDEFRELDSAVSIMAARVKDDYHTLKTFTENASHELMTPISIMNSKLDSFVQTGEFTDNQSKILNDVYGSLNRLTRLNKAMLLLVKIENGLINDEKEINLKKLTADTITQFEELTDNLNIEISSDLHDHTIKANLPLMEILLNNLIGNAIRHNKTDGQVSVSLDKKALRVINTGDNKALISQDIFQRFHKASASEGTGLGLTISQQICDNYGFKLSYSFEDGRHQFTILF
ncbi:HAMP domain-containing histidine kinase [Mucilaginibacter sp. JRF]|uniref:sensor histidine kinase n=1 Tax=Mucilaginibacter sp. JRF TaxID=2780088 RepID=UPI001881FF08|nr:HAMP domain-containing sensor histidine kinase [Mucilaginibacter sp. JRF]MBE9583483.1 HAMP domain-containing histidine kinase [Mucilaginibacter sp. JRF]